METVTYIMLLFGALAAIDRIFGCRLTLGNEFEKGIMMLGPLTLSMAGMLCIVPLIAQLLSGARNMFPDAFDFSIIPASLLANDMGGAHLSAKLANDNDIGVFNGLIVSSMMGCTVSFIIPYALQIVPKDKHDIVLYGLLCGIVTVPVGCFVSGLILGLAPLKLFLNLIPLIVFAAVIAIGLIKLRRVTVAVFRALGWVIRLIITVGLFIGISEFLTKKSIVPYTDSLENAMLVIINIACITVGAFPLLQLIKRLITPLLSKLGNKIGINETSAFGFMSTVGTSVTTFEMMEKMDDKGILLNSAFAVSASFMFVDHLAFTLSYDASYVTAMIAGKLISGMLAVLLASLLSKNTYK